MSAISIPAVQPQPDTYVAETGFGMALIMALWPWVTWALAAYADSMGAGVESWWEMIQPVGDDDGLTPTIGTFDAHGNLVTSGYSPPYGGVLDPSRASGSQLPYLGQFVGVQVPIGADDDTARALIFAQARKQRGTTAAMVLAAQAWLTGTQHCEVLERIYVDGTPAAGWFVMTVLTSEVINASALIAAVNAVKLGGLQWSLVQTSTWTISELEAAGYASLTILEAAFPSITALESDLP